MHFMYVYVYAIICTDWLHLFAVGFGRQVVLFKHCYLLLLFRSTVLDSVKNPLPQVTLERGPIGKHLNGFGVMFFPQMSCAVERSKSGPRASLELGFKLFTFVRS